MAIALQFKIHKRSFYLSVIGSNYTEKQSCLCGLVKKSFLKVSDCPCDQRSVYQMTIPKSCPFCRLEQTTTTFRSFETKIRKR